MPYPRLPFLFRWYLRRELPGWGRLYNRLNIHGIDNISPRWRDAPTLTTRGKSHGYKMRLDLNRDLDRSTYFLGRYYDLPNQLLLDAILRAGDTFIDGGANTGMMTLHAAARVGTSGRVYAFEPIPDNCRRIEQAIADNAISQVTIVDKALGTKPERLTLSILGGDTILSTLRAGPTTAAANQRKLEVDVIRGDDYFSDRSLGPLLIKLDLEGWEYHALQGLSETVARHRPPILVEIEPKYLRDTGVDENVLHEWFVSRRYRPFVVGLERTGLRTAQLRLVSYDKPQDLMDLNSAHPDKQEVRKRLGGWTEYNDVLWLPDGYDRLDLSKYVISM